MNSETQSPGPAPTKRRVRKRWIAVCLLLVFALQIWAAARNAGRVRAVVYNDGPGPVVEVTLLCAGSVITLGDLEEEQSRYAWFRPEKRSTVLTIAWQGPGGRREMAWAAERGERLTVRVRGGGEAEVSRERSLGRRFIDALIGE